MSPTAIVGDDIVGTVSYVAKTDRVTYFDGDVVENVGVIRYPDFNSLRAELSSTNKTHHRDDLHI